MRQKVTSSILGQGTYPGWGFNPWSGCIEETTNQCLFYINVSLSKINTKHIFLKERKKGIHVGKEEVKLSLCIDGMILYMEHPKISTKIFLELRKLALKGSKTQDQYTIIILSSVAQCWLHYLLNIILPKRQAKMYLYNTLLKAKTYSPHILIHHSIVKNNSIPGTRHSIFKWINI